MPEKTGRKIPFVPIIGIVIGFILGKFVSQQVSKYAPAGIGPMSFAEIGTVVVGLVLMWMGGRIHRLLRWIGVGIVAGALVEIVQSFLPATKV